MIYFFLLTLNLLMLILLVLIGVAFLTLLERKLLSYIHNRKGPNKVGFMGMIQPFSDALKLLSKEMMFLFINKFMYYISSMFMFFLSLLMWFLYPLSINFINDQMLLFIFLLGLSVYPILMVGWFSNNNYSLLGSFRSISQMISFEISLFFMLLIILMLIENFSFINLIKYQLNMKFFMLIFPIYFMFTISMLIELNRTPFDMTEGESELVSGFNTEYYSSGFVLIFLAEYSSIMFMSMILSMFFFGYMYWSLKFLFIYLIHLMFIIWIRGVLPRIRYDDLMYMCWIDFLMNSMIYLLMIYLVKEFIMILKS